VHKNISYFYLFEKNIALQVVEYERFMRKDDFFKKMSCNGHVIVYLVDMRKTSNQQNRESRIFAKNSYIMKKIEMNHVLTIKGQNRALEQIKGINHILSERSEAIRPTLIHGPSGCGKDHLITRWLRDLSEAGYKDQTHILDGDNLALQKSETTQDLVEALQRTDAGKVVLVINEAQKVFKGSKNKQAMERDLSKFVFPHGEVVQSFIAGDIARQEVCVNFHNLILILATNEPEEMETKGSTKKGETPFARRFSCVELSTYPQEEIEPIIHQVFESKGWKIGNEATGMVSRLHRGTMTAVMETCEKLKGVVSVGKSTVNKLEVITACRQTRFLPRGLYRKEGALLDFASRSIISSSSAQSILGGGASLFNASLLHLQNQFAKCSKTGSVIHTPLIAKVGGGYITTEAGKRYILAIQKDGFTF
jgi:Holliday junction resolvasome RuvABC ATP-dependent DNA helicase subunit